MSLVLFVFTSYLDTKRDIVTRLQICKGLGLQSPVCFITMECQMKIEKSNLNIVVLIVTCMVCGVPLFNATKKAPP